MAGSHSSLTAVTLAIVWLGLKLLTPYSVRRVSYEEEAAPPAA